MQLRANNFTGFHKDGSRYRILMEEKPDATNPKLTVITIEEKLQWSFDDKWYFGAICCTVYRGSEERSEAFKKALKSVERQTGLELIKREAVMLKTA